MRMCHAGSACGLIACLAASVACGDGARASGPAPTQPSPLSIAITMSARCPAPVYPGETANAACFVDIDGGAATPVSALADLRQFGGAAAVRLVPCPACGGIRFDMEVHVPADMPLGPRTIPVWAIDADGRRIDAAAVLQIAAP
jgi:hypothetical protein